MSAADEVRDAAARLRTDELPLLADLLDALADEMARADATVRRRLHGDGTTRIAVYPRFGSVTERPDWTAALAAARGINGSAS